MSGKNISFCKGKGNKKRGLIYNVQFSMFNFQLKIVN